MDSPSTFEQFLASQVPHVPFQDFLINLACTLALCWILSKIYVRYGRSLSHRAAFAANFVLLGATTMLVISVVKSSLALSLGLVGALSIVRFRAAIKEPEELSYLFLTIALGLGFGAGQRAITAISFVVVCLVIFISGRGAAAASQSHHFSVSGDKKGKLSLENATEVLRKHSQALSLRRVEESGSSLLAVYAADFGDFDSLARARGELLKLHKSVRVTLLDSLDRG